MTRREYEEIGRRAGWLDEQGNLVVDLKCKRCGYRWNDTYVRHNDPEVFCPKCGHLYADWLNYDQLKGDGAFTENEDLD